MSKVPLPGLTNNSSLSLNSNNMSTEKATKGKNPFANIGEWNMSNLNDIEVIISKPEETTSDFTRKKNKDNRYWKATVAFKTKNDKYESKIIKMYSCNVPYMKQTNYGNDYLIASLQKVVADKIVEAALKQNVIVDASDKRAQSTDDNWWLTINNTNGRLGLVDSQGNFDAKSLGPIFSKTELGMVINFDLVFSLKLTKTDRKDRASKDAFNLVADCSRGAVKAIRQEIDPPTIEGGIPQQPASKVDVASQELIDMFDEFGV